MFKLYKRGSGKIWQISYVKNGNQARESTKTNLFCLAVMLGNKMIEDQMREKAQSEKYRLARWAVQGKIKENPSDDGFDMFYINSNQLPFSCSCGLGVVYIIKNKYLVKIGISTSPRRRIRGIENAIGSRVSAIYLSRQCANYRDIEQNAHIIFNERRQVGEWFEADFESVVYYFHGIKNY